VEKIDHAHQERRRSNAGGFLRRHRIEINRKRLVAVIVLAAIPVSGSTGPADSTGSEKNRMAAAAVAAWNNQIVPGERIGPLRLSGNIGELEKLLGKPVTGDAGPMV
jgi:hypothetical protein